MTSSAAAAATTRSTAAPATTRCGATRAPTTSGVGRTATVRVLVRFRSVLVHAGDTGVGAGNRDIIHDFQHGADAIVLDFMDGAQISLATRPSPSSAAPPSRRRRRCGRPTSPATPLSRATPTRTQRPSSRSSSGAAHHVEQRLRRLVRIWRLPLLGHLPPLVSRLSTGRPDPSGRPFRSAAILPSSLAIWAPLWLVPASVV